MPSNIRSKDKSDARGERPGRTPTITQEKKEKRKKELSSIDYGSGSTM